jgi:hypothetical protein
MDEQTRKAWSRPELIVIVRSGPEEAVLAGCKTLQTFQGGEHVADGECYGLVPGVCGACYADSGS